MSAAAGNILVDRVRAPTDDVRVLVGELEATLAAVYPAEQRHGLPLEAIFEPHIHFFVASRDGEPAGCGGVAFFPGFAEVKRMYVRSALRGAGIAPAILATLEREAKIAGVSDLRLETGTQQVAAMRFYEREGFERCGAFGMYASLPAANVAGSVFFAKTLSCPPREAASPLPDDELLARFHATTLHARDWTHHSHLRVAYLHALRYRLDEAHLRMRAGIIRLNAAQGLVESITRGYHETLTRVWLALVGHAIAAGADQGSSEAFASANIARLHREAPLAFYTRERLFSAEARSRFVEPDLAPLP
jgi:putative acetyltransferase